MNHLLSWQHINGSNVPHLCAFRSLCLLYKDDSPSFTAVKTQSYNPILGSVNIGSVHKSSELASPLGFLLHHRQQDGGGGWWRGGEHIPQHYTCSLAKSRSEKRHSFSHRGSKHLCNVGPPHGSVRLLNSMKSLAIYWSSENTVHRNTVPATMHLCFHFPTSTPTPAVSQCSQHFSVYCITCACPLCWYT